MDQSLTSQDLIEQDKDFPVFLLIRELETNPHTDWSKKMALITQYIDSNDISEEYCQRLLHCKITYLISQCQFKEAFDELEKLENDDNRLVCNTSEYFRLLLLKSQIFIITNNFYEAQTHLGVIKDLYLTDEDFFSLPDHLSIMQEWCRQSAIVSHFSEKKDSYELFTQLINNPQNSFPLNESNINVYILFGNECIRQLKYTEALNIFSQLKYFAEVKSNSVDLDLYLEIMAMELIAKNLVSPSLVAEHDYFKYLSLVPNAISDKNQKLKERIIHLKAGCLMGINKKGYFPRFNFNATLEPLPQAGQDATMLGFDCNVSNTTEENRKKKKKSTCVNQL